MKGLAPLRCLAVWLLVCTPAGCGLLGADDPQAQISRNGDDLAVTFPVGVVEAELPTQAPPGGSTARQGDGSVLVLDSEGGLVLAYLPPEPADVVRLDPAGRQVEAKLRDPEATEPVSVTIATGNQLVDSTRWLQRNDGRSSLEVIPSALGRRWSSPSATDAGWAQVVAQQADADTPGMKEQYRCHAQFAPDKDGWYLEPWRPAGSYFEVVAARCNRGPESDPEL